MGELDSIILENTNNLVLLLDRDANVTYISPSVKKILGYNPSELLGVGWFEKTRNNFMKGKKVQLEIRKQINSEEGFSGISMEREILDARKERRQFIWNTSLGPDDRIIGIGTDVSAKKEEQQRLEQAKEKVEVRQSEIEASIRYAKRLQSSFLPSEAYLKSCFKDAFVFHRSKDIVSGDFYWAYRNEKKAFVAVADCTGHGVPGAFISIVGNTILKDIIIRKRIYNPAKILQELDNELQFALRNPADEKVVSDGMDIALMVYDFSSGKVKFAGANRPLFLYRDGEIIQVKPDKFGIGYISDFKKVFSSITIEMEQSDMIYLFSDGYTDQFGGENIRKFNRRRFIKLLESIGEQYTDRQKIVVEDSFDAWKGRNEQIDDVTVLGIRF